MSAEDLAKRVKKLKKQLKQIDELAAKVAGGLSPSSEQREKLDKKAAVAADLAAAEALL